MSCIPVVLAGCDTNAPVHGDDPLAAEDDCCCFCILPGLSSAVPVTRLAGRTMSAEAISTRQLTIAYQAACKASAQGTTQKLILGRILMFSGDCNAASHGRAKWSIAYVWSSVDSVHRLKAVHLIRILVSQNSASSGRRPRYCNIRFTTRNCSLMNSRIEMVVCDAGLTFQKSVCGIEISERRPRDGPFWDGPFLDHLQGNSTNQGA
jgi:hypothetical protein